MERIIYLYSYIQYLYYNCQRKVPKICSANMIGIGTTNLTLSNPFDLKKKKIILRS